MLVVPYGTLGLLVGRSDTLRFEGTRPNQAEIRRPLIRRHIRAVVDWIANGVSEFLITASMALLSI